jgi:hypothetical protein
MGYIATSVVGALTNPFSYQRSRTALGLGEGPARDTNPRASHCSFYVAWRRARKGAGHRSM